MTLLEELKRRKVVRTTLAYLAAAFVAAQALQLISDALDLPRWIFKSFVILLLVALPLVIGLAWAFDVTPEGVKHTSTSEVKVRWKRVALPGFVSLMLLFIIVGFYLLNKSEVALNNSLVAVLPFHVSGDPQITYLQNGMVDLVAAKLTGEGGPRGADPRAVMSAVRKAGTDEIDDAKAREIARSIGAAQVLTGSIVGSARQFTIHAQLTRANGAKITAEEVTSVDSMLSGIDRLVGKLLSLQAGEGQRLDALTTSSLPALRAFLEAQAQYRSGHFGIASELYARAVDQDSTFALAALGYKVASGWGEAPAVDEAKLDRALKNNMVRLGPIDRAIALSMYNPDGRPYADRIAAREAIVNQAPDRADAWFLYADMVTHWGMTADMNAPDVADKAFNRILTIDSTYLPALVHLMDNAWLAGRYEDYKRLDAIRRVRDPGGNAALYQKAWRAHLLGDSAELRAERAAMDTMHSAQLAIIAWIGGSSAGASRDAVAALDKMLAHAATKAERLDALALASTLFLSYGMPARAAAAAEEEAGLMDDPVPVRTWQIAAALYGSGDTTSAARAIQLLPALYEKTDARNRVDAKCMSEQWELWHGRTENFAKIESEMAAIKTDVPAIRNDAQVCALTLNVIRSMQSSSADLRTRVSALDAVMQRGPALQSLLRNVANIVLARGAERAGDKVLAYRATKRAPVHPAGWQLRDVMQRESARLAALNGDRAYAIMQYKRYLDAHEIAEPALRQQDDGARADLARLTGERR